MRVVAWVELVCFITAENSVKYLIINKINYYFSCILYKKVVSLSIEIKQIITIKVSPR